MSTKGSFTAPPVKRYYAYVVDAVATLLLYMVIAGVAEGLKYRLAGWHVLALVYGVYQGAMVATRQGQTLGRDLAGITVLGVEGAPVTLTQAFARTLVRVAPLALAGVSPLSQDLGVLAFLLLLLADAGLIEQTPTRQTLGDLLARTMVVDLPPPHTHRAPAGPMYSRTDAEFGIPPKGPEGPEK